MSLIARDRYEELQATLLEKKQLISAWKESRFHSKISQVDEIAEEVVPALSPASRSNSISNNEDVKERVLQWKEAKERELAIQKVGGGGDVSVQFNSSRRNTTSNNAKTMKLEKK